MRERDGSTTTYFFPDRVPTPGNDRESCMRAQGFVRVPGETSVWRPFTQAPRAP